MQTALMWLSLAVNLAIWSSLFVRRTWRTIPALFWTEMVSLATTVWVYYAITQPWWHRPVYDAEEAFTIATQIVMACVLSRRNEVLAGAYLLYVFIACAQGIYDHTGNEGLVEHIRQIRVYDSIVTSALLAWWLARGRIGAEEPAMCEEKEPCKPIDPNKPHPPIDPDPQPDDDPANPLPPTN